MVYGSVNMGGLNSITLRTNHVYMSVINNQQNIIDQVISNYIKTNDNTARQYLKLRKDALEIAQKIKAEISENGRPSSERLLQLQNIQFESDKILQSYDAYVLRIRSNLEFSKIHKPQYLNELKQQFTELSRRLEKVKSDLSLLKTSTKPIVDKMKVLAEKYENVVSIKGARSNKFKNQPSVSSNKGSNRDANSTLIDFSSAVFEKSELEGIFDDMKSKLANLRTVDEISDQLKEEGDKPQSLTDAAPSINVTKYLDELLQNSRAYSHFGDTKYHFDISKSTSVDVGSSSLVIDDYDKAIDVLSLEIQGLVARGTEAKERWIRNAKKLETIQTILQEDNLDVEM